ncbi:MAG: putative Ig domain-containing protein, partial [Usitatibacteraceae bacterium]
MSLRALKWIPRSLFLLMLFANASSAGIFAPLLVTPTLPNAVINVPYSARLMISSLNDGANTANVSGLPAGLSFTADLGSIIITGTPTRSGNFPLTVTATHSVAPLSTVVPLRVDQFATNVVAIDAGGSHTCAVVNGGVQGWGLALLGNNSTATSAVGVRVITPGSGATAVSAGGGHSCAVVSGGLQCWGTNESGQLGNNTTAQSLVPVSIFGAGSNVTAVSAGGSHTCAVINGGVQCWGRNISGQLGNSSTVDSPNPVTAVPPLSGATAVAAGNSHTCAVVSGGVEGWGQVGFGELGY